MRFVHDERVKAFLPQVSLPAVAGVDPGCIEGMRRSKQIREAVVPRRNGDKVNVIGHQAIGPDLSCRTPQLASQDGKIVAKVVVAKERRLLPASTLSYVMGITRHNETRHPWHGDSTCM
jgi:hypothetical protein